MASCGQRLHPAESAPCGGPLVEIVHRARPCVQRRGPASRQLLLQPLHLLLLSDSQVAPRGNQPHEHRAAHLDLAFVEVLVTRQFLLSRLGLSVVVDDGEAVDSMLLVVLGVVWMERHVAEMAGAARALDLEALAVVVWLDGNVASEI